MEPSCENLSLPRFASISTRLRISNRQSQISTESFPQPLPTTQAIAVKEKWRKDSRSIYKARVAHQGPERTGKNRTQCAASVPQVLSQDSLIRSLTTLGTNANKHGLEPYWQDEKD
jgi:hypothetical protein